MFKRLSLLVLFLVAFAGPTAATVPQQKPMTLDEVRDLLKKNKNSPDVVLKALDARKVNFDISPDVEKKLRKAGATDDMLQAVWKATPKGQNAATASLTSPTGVQLKATDKESMGYQTLQRELDPEKKLRMVEEFAQQFPNSQLLSYIYTQGANASQAKNDLEGILSYCDKSLKLDPDNIYSLVIAAVTLPQPQMQRGPDAAQRLAQAQQYAKRALSLMDKFPKQPNEADEQFQKRKGALLSEAHGALGMVYLQSDQPDKAIEEFKTAVSLDPTPDPQIYYRLGEVYANEGKKNDALAAFTKASELSQGTPLKEYADREIEKLKKQ